MTQTSNTQVVPPAKCPMALELDNHAEGNKETLCRLMRTSEVARDYPADSPLASVLDWMHNFLSHPHPELGRKGAVCPFVPVSLEKDSIWLAEIVAPDPSLESVSALISQFRQLFLTTEPTSGPDMINKAFVVAFPHLSAESASLVDQVQSRLKMDFVDCGLMLGEFHGNNESAGLRNAQFRPLRSPIPMLGMRHMVESDLPFLQRADLPPQERSSFLRSYLFRLAGSLSAAKFEQALDGVIQAEIEKWITNNIKSDAQALSTEAEVVETEDPECVTQ